MVDIAFAVTGQAVSTVEDIGRRLQPVVATVARAVLRPAIVPVGLQPATLLSGLAKRGVGYRGQAHVEMTHLLDTLVPVIVDKLASRIDLTQLVQDHVDLGTVAQQVIADIDLSEIIRESTAAVASDTLLGVRLQSISGDEAISRALHQLRSRLAGHALETSPAAGASASS